MQLRSSRLAALLAVTALAVGTLSACAPEPDPDPAPRWTASASPEVAEPLFASDEEALAAAEAAYAAYLTTSARIAARGDGDASELESLVSPPYFDELSAEVTAFASQGRRMTGEPKYDSVRLVQQKIRDDGSGEMQIYVCQDISEVKTFDAAGAEEAPGERQERLPLIVLIVSNGSDSNPVVVGGSDVWRGENFC